MAALYINTMAKYWREKQDPKLHMDHLNCSMGGAVRSSKKPRDNLLESWVYFVEVKGVILEFHGIDQVLEAREYFSKKTHSSTREYLVNHDYGEHEWQPWYCRLPKRILKECNRLKLLKVLESVIQKWGKN